jgi:CheY-like chemotaxis protein
MSYILIIESDQWYRQSVANMIKSHEVMTASTPEQAIEKIDENIPYMIYLDLNLGVRNGMTVLNELQSWTDTRRIPVVLLVDSAQQLNLQDWRQYGVVGILDKLSLTEAKLTESLGYG